MYCASTNARLDELTVRVSQFATRRVSFRAILKSPKERRQPLGYSLPTGSPLAGWTRVGQHLPFEGVRDAYGRHQLIGWHLNRVMPGSLLSTDAWDATLTRRPQETATSDTHYQPRRHHLSTHQ